MKKKCDRFCFESTWFRFFRGNAGRSYDPYQVNLQLLPKKLSDVLSQASSSEEDQTDLLPVDFDTPSSKEQKSLGGSSSAASSFLSYFYPGYFRCWFFPPSFCIREIKDFSFSLFLRDDKVAPAFKAEELDHVAFAPQRQSRKIVQNPPPPPPHQQPQFQSQLVLPSPSSPAQKKHFIPLQRHWIRLERHILTLYKRT